MRTIFLIGTALALVTGTEAFAQTTAATNTPPSAAPNAEDLRVASWAALSASSRFERACK